MLELQDVDVAEISLDGIVVPMLNLTHADRVDVRLRFRGQDYTFTSSALEAGYGAVLPGRVQQALAESRQALVVQRGERYYLYLTPAQASSP